MSNAPAFDAARRSREFGRLLERKGKHAMALLKQAWAFSAVQAERGRTEFISLDRRATARVDAFPEERVRLAAVGAAGVVMLGIIAILIAPAFTDSKTDNAPVSNVQVAQAYTSGVSDGRNGRTFALVNGEPLFPLPNASLSFRVDQPVEMQSVMVQAVVPGVGLWAGDSAEQRVFVAVSPEADAKGTVRLAAVQPGEMLNLSGRIKALSLANPAAGVPAELGQAQLMAQGGLVQADNLRFATTP